MPDRHPHGPTTVHAVNGAGPGAAQGADGLTVQRLSLRSSDVDEVRTFGSHQFFPRRYLHPLHRSERIAARFDVLRLGPSTIADARFGANVTLAYRPDAYQVAVPLAGRLVAHQGDRAIVCAGSLASISRVEEDVVIDRWGADCHLLIVTLERDILERRLQTLLDAPTQPSIKLAAQLDIDAGLGRSWAALVRMLAHEHGNTIGMLDYPLMLNNLQENLITGLLLAVDHPGRAALTQLVRTYRPLPVRRTIQAIQAHPEHPFTIATLAGAAGVSVRTLQAGFRRYIGSTPMEYLRKVRLARAHEDLRAADPHRTTVAEVAYRWGFTHLGRFAATYQARYHTRPSDTLYRA